MSLRARDIEAFLARCGATVLVTVEETRGSSPREAGAAMLVSANEALGTIGGGQLEFIAMDAARKMLSRLQPSPSPGQFLEIPLGPEIGQCCGGRVKVGMRLVDDALRAEVLETARAAEAARRQVYVFGAGHVGRALAQALALLPLKVTITDVRPGVLEGLPGEIHAEASALPEALVRKAPAGAAFVVLTHDHALDFLITKEALARNDAAYVGMIGSRTKRASFRSWYLREGGAREALARLVCPIGASALGDKRPEIIAALVVAEILGKLGQSDCPAPGKNAKLKYDLGVV